MPLINLTLEHGRPLEEARRHLENDRSRVRLEGVEFWIELEPAFAFRGQDGVAGPSDRSRPPRVLPRRVYFLSAAFFSAGAFDVDFAIDVVGTMMWAYGVPFHITHGPPFVQSVPYASS
jgi:hypothetical protein